MSEPHASSGTLLSFAPMIDSESSRLLLGHYGVPYREEPHIFGWASVLSLLRGGTPQIPLFSSLGVRLAGPRAIAEHFEPLCAPERRLIPANSLQAMQVNADWARFNGILAGATAALAYGYLLPHRAIMLEPFCRGIPPAEAACVKPAYPLLVWLFDTLLQLGPAKMRASLSEIRTIFDETDLRLADGRRYLVGDRLTLSEIALASAAAPVLLPAGSASPIPPLELMPTEMRAVVFEMRQRPTGKFVQRLFSTWTI